MDFEELYQKAASVLNSRELSEHAQAGTVAAAILTESGNVYTGVHRYRMFKWGFVRSMPPQLLW